jgi:transposase
MVRAKKYDAVKKQPPKKLNKRKFFSYSDDAIKRALFEIRENNMSTREASRQFGVPRTTIQDRLKRKSPENIVRRTGPPPIMTREGEQKIAEC